MQKRSGSISSPLRGYVARLFNRDMARSKRSASSDAVLTRDMEVLPMLESLEQRVLLSASYGPELLQLSASSDSQDTPTVDVAKFASQSLSVSNIKWHGEQVDAVQYEWIVRYSVDEHLSDADLNALAESLSPFAEIENMYAEGFGILTAPFPKMKGWQLNRWAKTQDMVAYLEPNFVGTLADTTPDDPGYYGMWGLDNSYQTLYDWDSSTSTFLTTETNYGVADSGIDASGVWYADVDEGTVTTGSYSVVVPVFDSGIDYTHPDLYMNIWINQGEIPEDARIGGDYAISDVDGDGLITFYDLNHTSNATNAYVAPLIAHDNGNGYIDGGDLLNDTYGWEVGGDDDENGLTDDIIGWNYISNTNDPMDDLFHGTHVAGTIGAMGNNGLGITGVNWSVQLMPVKIIGSDGYVAVSGVVDALDCITDLKNVGGDNIVAVNHSWDVNGSDSVGLYDAFMDISDEDILQIICAHNYTWDLENFPLYPAVFSFDNIITVAAVDSSNEIAYFSNYGYISVDLGAPGVSILSTTPVQSTASMISKGKSSYYDLNNGTSMATPHVTGVAALLAAFDPNASASDIKSAILYGGVPTASLSGLTVTGRRLNAYRAMQALTGNGPYVESISPGMLTPTTDTITINFTQNILGSSIIPANFSLITDGVDNIFGTVDDQTIAISSTELPQPQTTSDQVAISFSSDLPAETYRLKLVGKGSTPLRNTSNVAIEVGTDYVYEFTLVESDFSEQNDNIDDATLTGISGSGTYIADGYIGDGQIVGKRSDVDIFKVYVNQGGSISAAIEASTGSELDSYLRVFDASGNEIAENDDWEVFDSNLKYTVATAGYYYIGVSGRGNHNYHAANQYQLYSRFAGSTGAYKLTIEVDDAPSPTTAICGSVWHDIDGNGDNNDGAGGLSGWRVFIDSIANGLFDEESEQSVVTDQNGEYMLEDTGVGTFTVLAVSPSGWGQTSAAHSSISVGQGQTVTDVDFGGRITGSTITVDSTLDLDSERYTQAGDISLRSAIKLSNLYPEANTIVFSTTFAEPVVDVNKAKLNPVTTGQTLSIQGPSSGDFTIRVAGAYLGTTAVDHFLETKTDSTLSITNLTIDGEYLSSISAEYILDTVIFAMGSLDIDDVTISNFEGGAVAVGGDLELSNSVLLDNDGTALRTWSTNALIENCALSGNVRGILNSGNLTVANSTISDHYTTEETGSGISNSGGTLTVVNSTITNNHSDIDGTESGLGAGIEVTGGTVTLQNTIVAGNTSGTSSTADDVAGVFSMDSSHNLISVIDGSTYLDEENSLWGTLLGGGSQLDPGLEDTPNSDGTYALEYGSPAIDAGSNSEATTAGLTTDQRGEERFAYGTASGSRQVDIGAYEWQPTVITVDENGAGTTANGTTSIREALAEAEVSQPATLTVIEFGAGFTNPTVYLGATGELEINSDVKILGATASGGSVIFDGQSGSGGTERIFNVASGVDAAIHDVVMQYGTASAGGGLQNAGTLLLDDVTVQNNVASSTFGGGIYNTSTGVLTVQDSLFVSNDAIVGGGIANDGDMIIERTMMWFNTSDAGGAIANTATGSMELIDSTVAYNTSDGGGGGVFTVGEMTLKNSTISTNSADGAGGGVYQSSGTLEVINATITLNHSDADNNSPGDTGGGIYRSSASTSTHLYNSIVFDNDRGTNSPVDDDLSGTFDSGSLNNLIGVFSTGSGISDGVNGNMVGTGYDPNLGSLTSNGGPTLTHALQSGSAAIDAGTNTIDTTSIIDILGDWDQRGDTYSRIVNGGDDDTVDIGAYEYVPA